MYMDGSRHRDAENESHVRDFKAGVKCRLKETISSMELQF